MLISSELESLMTGLQNNIDSAIRELARCPEGAISSWNRDGKQIIYHDTRGRINKDGKRPRHRAVITGDDEMIGLLLRREYLKQQLYVMEGNLKILAGAAEKINPADETTMLRALMKKYDWVKGKHLDLAVQSSDASAYDWTDSPLNENLFREDELKHWASWGLRVRSKSELLIAEKVHSYKQLFKYEVPIICAGHPVTPDFQIKRADGKIIWWEHRGLMSDPNYARKQYEKDFWYYQEGIVPWDNLIVTYDNYDGEINLKIVDAEIRSKILL